MSGFQEETTEVLYKFSIGDDVTDLSSSDIEYLIDRFHHEIDRLREEYSQRGSSRALAEALFR